MEKKDTLSSCSESEEQQMQLIQDKSKESCMVSFQRLHSHLKRLSNNDLKGSRTENGFGRAFATLFGQDFEIFTGTMFLNMDQLQKQLDNNEFQEIGSMASFKVLETQFQMFIKSKIYLNDEYISIDERALHKREHDSKVNERQTQTTMEKDTNSRSGNDAHVDDADTRPIYDEEPKAENAEQCHDTCPLPAKLTDDKTIELSNQLLESENVCLKKTVAQSQKDFAKLEAHCINLELQMENNVLKSGQLSQFLKEKSNEAKVKNDIDVTETINIELEHSVAKLLAENEQFHKEKDHLKQTYKDLFYSIKRTRVHTKDQNDSLMAQLNKKSNENGDVLAQIQKKGFIIAALKNELRKLTRNSVNTKFAKPSILGKPVLQPHRNQSVVRQPTAFKFERPKISKPQFGTQVDVNNDLSKPVTTHYLPKRRESAHAKPHNMIAPSSSRWVPTGKIFTSSTTKVDNEPPNGSKEDITNQCEREQALDVSVVTQDQKRQSRLNQRTTLINPGKAKWYRQRFSLNMSSACMRKLTLLDLILVGNQRVEFQTVSLRGTSVKVLGKGKTQSLVTKKTDISYVRSSRNSNLMNMLQMMFGQNSSSLVLHQMSFGQNSSSLVLHQMTFGQNSSSLGVKSISLTEAEEEAVAREVHATHAGTVSGPDPEPVQEDQTGSNFGKLHVSLAGPNPEHMDDEFLATAYPKVHENLKLITDETCHEGKSIKSS
ncbi:hypothetical protein Tco_0891422 [Tanacetum coccineum]|uniref:Uncharacterized protein n=1 Tax=Tanacetum coccineum TaxID=301880 RepID=A0ABQ5C363_9ASTR